MAEKPKKDIALSVSAIFIAICALFISIWQVYETTKHNRLSVKPNLTVAVEYLKADSVSVKLANNGLGPALIQNIIIFIDSTQCEGRYHDIMTQFANLIRIGNYDLKYKFLEKGEPIKAGNSIKLISIYKNNLSMEERKNILDALKRMFILIEYTSMYDQLFTMKIEFIELLGQVDYTRLKTY